MYFTKLPQLAFAALLPCIFLLGGCSSTSGYPPDHLLEARFRNHEAEFSRLLNIFKVDSHLFLVDSEAAYSARNTRAVITEERLEEYQRLLSKLELDYIARTNNHEGHEEISLRAWTRPHLLLGAKSKFYIYREIPPSPLVESLDGLVGGTDAYAYKRIAENWYLFLDVW